MRFRSVVVFGRLIGAAGLGAALGAAVAGLIAIVLGQAFQPGSTWLTGLPVLAVLGAGVGACAARLTRQWFVPTDPHRHNDARRRMLLFTAAGLVAVPLAVAVGQLHAIAAMAIPLMLAGSAVTLTLWMRAFRRNHPGRHGGRPVVRPAAR
ncbi:hypothetical protein [Haloechinothrix halophila]|uniref:hypothetical protein n=1 Tax=Haloechinothrix halophila TaxID=1069073 RepID=UPI000558FB02|nr:hypothetical protein [Haloechinothrix halophila]